MLDTLFENVITKNHNFILIRSYFLFGVEVDKLSTCVDNMNKLNSVIINIKIMSNYTFVAQMFM